MTFEEFEQGKSGIPDKGFVLEACNYNLNTESIYFTFKNCGSKEFLFKKITLSNGHPTVLHLMYTPQDSRNIKHVIITTDPKATYELTSMEDLEKSGWTIIRVPDIMYVKNEYDSMIECMKEMLDK